MQDRSFVRVEPFPIRFARLRSDRRTHSSRGSSPSFATWRLIGIDLWAGQGIDQQVEKWSHVGRSALAGIQGRCVAVLRTGVDIGGRCRAVHRHPVPPAIRVPSSSASVGRPSGRSTLLTTTIGRTPACRRFLKHESRLRHWALRRHRREADSRPPSSRHVRLRHRNRRDLACRSN